MPASPTSSWFETLADGLERELRMRAFVDARDLDSGDRCSRDADEPVVAASVFKVPVLLEYALQCAAGELDPTEPIEVRADLIRTPGGTGLSCVLDDVRTSLRDLALSMMSVSDNRATDIVMDLVGIDRVNATLDRLGLPGSRLVADCRGLFAQIEEDTGLGPDDPALAQPGPVESARLRASRPLDPRRTNGTTATEATELLRRIWTDDGLPPAVCAEVRRILGLQVWPHRLSSGFPDARVKVSGKTGTLWTVRNEVGVVEYPDGGRYAVGVFLLLEDAGTRAPDADRAIGTLGRAAVDALRAG